jgi:hypothetical protein
VLVFESIQQADLQADLQQKHRHIARAEEFIAALPLGLARLDESVRSVVSVLEAPEVRQRTHIHALF